MNYFDADGAKPEVVRNSVTVDAGDGGSSARIANEAQSKAAPKKVTTASSGAVGAGQLASKLTNRDHILLNNPEATVTANNDVATVEKLLLLYASLMEQNTEQSFIEKAKLEYIIKSSQQLAEQALKNIAAACTSNFPKGIPWYLLDDHWTLIHRYVQEDIVKHNGKYEMEKRIPTTLYRVDIIDEIGQKIWEVKSAGPASLLASKQLEDYLNLLGSDYGYGVGIPANAFTRYDDKYTYRDYYVYYWEDSPGIIKYVWHTSPTELERVLSGIGISVAISKALKALENKTGNKTGQSRAPAPGYAVSDAGVAASALAFAAIGIGLAMGGMGGGLGKDPIMFAALR